MVFCIQALTGKDPQQVESFAWPAGMEEDDADLLEAVAAYFQVGELEASSLTVLKRHMAGDALASLE